MWFEAVLLCCAGMVLFKFQLQQYHSVDQKANMQIAVWVAVPVFFMFMFRQTFSVNELLAGYLVLCFLLCSKRLVKCSSKVSALPAVKAYLLKILTAFIVGMFVTSYDTPAAGSDDMAYEQVVLMFVCISLLLLFSKQLEAHIRKRGFGIYVQAFALAVPVLGFYLTEWPFNTDLQNMAWEYSIGNILWLGCVFLILYCLMQKKKKAVGIFLTGCLIFGVANYYVSKFRGSPVMPSDLMSVGTAFQVAGGYEFEVSGRVVGSVLCWYTCMAVLCCLPETESAIKSKTSVIAASLTVCICAGYLYFLHPQDKYGWELDPWDIGASYREAGSVLGFTALLNQMKVEMPDGYSRDRVDAILQKSKYVTQASKQTCKQTLVQTTQKRETRKPTVIAIMVETFSDLSSLGDFTCSEPYLQHWYEVDDYACRGKLYVSAYGGGTANTEFEFLTGNSMGNCPAGIVPYQSYSFKNVENLAGFLANAGYDTVAMHPQNKGNWNRMRVYQNLGFANFLGIADFTEPTYVRQHVSDQACVDQVIGLYEKNSSRQQFMFTVTMQNHGGYSLQEMQGMDIISLKGQQEAYEDVEAYLTLVRESDKALFKLIQYFRAVEDPVILCMFGDHQPRLNTAWVEQVMGKAEGSLSLQELEQKYAVPYMIWANFDTPYQGQELDTSTNYLGALLLQNAGVEQTAYMRFLLDMRQQIPAMNAFGYMTNDGNWHSYEEESEVSGWMDDYKILQYHAMFDPKRDIGND